MKDSCIIKKIFIIGILLLMPLLLSSCGANMDTKLIVNNDSSGYREITCTVDNNDLKNFVYGDDYGMELFIRQNIPKEMTYKITKDKSNTVLHFYIQFKTIAEYKNKVAKILNRDTSSIIVIRNNMFLKGTYISEDFSSNDLLAWLSKALISNGILPEDTIAVNNQSTKLIIGSDEKTLDLNKNNGIFYSDINDSGAEKAEVSTKYTNGQFVRVISLYFKNEIAETLDTKKITQFIKEKSKSKVTTKQEDMYTVFTVTIKGDSIEELANNTAALIGGDSVSYSYNYLPNFNVEVTSFETFDFSNIVSINSGSNTIKNVVPCPTQATICDAFSQEFSLQNNDDKTIVINGTCGIQPTIAYTCTGKAAFSKIDVTTDLSKSGKFTRSIMFYIPTDQHRFYGTEYDKILLSDKIDKRVNRYGSNTEDYYIYTWVYSADSIKNFNDITSQVFKHSEDFTYQKAVIDGRIQFMIYDNLNIKGTFPDIEKIDINYYLIPPPNTKAIDSMKDSKNSIVLNFDKKNNYYAGNLISDKIDVNANIDFNNYIFFLYLLISITASILIILISVRRCKKGAQRPKNENLSSSNQV